MKKAPHEEHLRRAHSFLVGTRDTRDYDVESLAEILDEAFTLGSELPADRPSPDMLDAWMRLAAELEEFDDNPTGLHQTVEEACELMKPAARGLRRLVEFVRSIR